MTGASAGTEQNSDQQSSADQSVSYRLAGPENWRMRVLDDNVVLYHGLSGDTHILNFLSESILRCLADGPLAVSDLADKVRADLTSTETMCPDSLIQSSLADLDVAGLVWPAYGTGDPAASKPSAAEMRGD